MEVVFARLLDGTGFVKPPTRYTYKLKTMDSFGSHVVQQSTVTSVIEPSEGINEYRRTLVRSTGIFISIRTSGQVGVASLSQFVIALASAFALLKLANLFVEMVLVRLYRNYGGTKVSLMWDVYKQDHAPNEQEF